MLNLNLLSNISHKHVSLFASYLTLVDFPADTPITDETMQIHYWDKIKSVRADLNRVLRPSKKELRRLEKEKRDADKLAAKEAKLADKLAAKLAKHTTHVPKRKYTKKPKTLEETPTLDTTVDATLDTTVDADAVAANATMVDAVDADATMVDAIDADDEAIMGEEPKKKRKPSKKAKAESKEEGESSTKKKQERKKKTVVDNIVITYDSE